MTQFLTPVAQPVELVVPAAQHLRYFVSVKPRSARMPPYQYIIPTDNRVRLSL